jgi:Cu/Ag efflux pump CusA
MGIVRLALRRPYTFIVMGLLIAVLGILSVLTMSTDGPAKYLFTPMALTVVFAMLASYLLSRTLGPVMAHLRSLIRPVPH